ncbi:UNVERIFIED_CONTAM: hypothetical protein FKN15_033188 [Acipenser sinensis]
MEYSLPCDAVGARARNNLPARIDSEISPYACYYGSSKRRSLKGWLDKLSPQGKCVFQKRWVKFDGESLSYFNNDKEMYSKGLIPLSAINTVRPLGDSKFEVVTSHRTFVFRVEKEGDRYDWINTLLIALRTRSRISQGSFKRTFDRCGYLELRGHKGKIFMVLVGTKVRLCKNEQDFKSGLAITVIGLDVTTVNDLERKCFELNTPFRNFCFAADSEREKQEWIEAVQESIAETLSDYEVAEKIWFNESNRSCADCCAPKPEWASINLCVVICKKCAAQHRSLGSNISKVRSLKLDTSIWNNELVELFLVVGNRGSNSFWAANLPQEEQLDSDGSPEQRNAFIVKKYKDRKFRKILSDFVNQEQLNQALCVSVLQQDALETMSLVFSGADVMCATGDPIHCTPYLLAQTADFPKLDPVYERRFNHDASSFMHGFLYEAVNIAKSFTEKKLKDDMSRRWCTLEGGFLSYYENDKTATPNGRIDISEVVCLAVDKTEYIMGVGAIFTFEIYLLSERAFLFGTQTTGSQSDWAQAIAKHFIPSAVENLSEKDYELIGRLYYKEGRNLYHWGVGWFALDKSCLYFCDELDRAEVESLQLKRLQELTVSTQLEGGERIDVLLLVESGRTLYIHGNTKLDFMVWYSAIQKAAGTNSNALPDQQLSKNDIPIIVESCIAFVTQYGLCYEGIYQKNGNPALVAQLLERFRKDARNVKLRAGQHQLEDVTDVLKCFLFKIDDALLTKELYPYWISVLGNTKGFIKSGYMKFKEGPSKLLSGNKFQDRYFILRDEKLLQFRDIKILRSTPLIYETQILRSTPLIYETQILRSTPLIYETQILRSTPLIYETQILRSTPLIYETQILRSTPLIYETQILRSTPLIYETQILRSTPLIYETQILRSTPLIYETQILRSTPLIYETQILRSTPLIYETQILRSTPLIYETQILRSTPLIYETQILRSTPLIYETQILRSTPLIYETQIL